MAPAESQGLRVALRHLFTKRGEAALAAAMRRRPLLAFDFDGTLAPIVARPDDARVPTAVSARLSWLAGRVPVAIVTGRAVSDVRGRLGFVPQYIVGNHGAEDGEHGDGAAALMRALDPMRQLLFARAAALAEAGVTVEDKALSIALHYRLSRTPDAAVALIGELTSGLPASLQVFAGKMVVNAMAAYAPDKADAVRHLQARSGAACVFYAGDDINDEPVFDAASAQWLTVRIGRDDHASRAQYFLDSVSEMAPLLERMLAHLHTPRHPA
jgi:trehalose 6-phosphate phosphatase